MIFFSKFEVDFPLQTDKPLDMKQAEFSQRPDRIWKRWNNCKIHNIIMTELFTLKES